MSIENNLASIAKSLEIIAKVLSEGKQDTPVPAPVATTPPPVVAPVVVEPPKVEVAVPVVTPPPVAAPEPVVSVPVSSAPFSDHKGLIEYTMAAYKSLGPEKGANIQKIMANLGVGNINDMKPEQYGDFYKQVEALKG